MLLTNSIPPLTLVRTTVSPFLHPPPPSSFIFSFPFFPPLSLSLYPSLQVLVTDFFGSVRNIELMNDTAAVSQERGEEEKEATPPPPFTQKEPVVQPVSAYQLTPQEFLVSKRKSHPPIDLDTEKPDNSKMLASLDVHLLTPLVDHRNNLH